MENMPIHIEEVPTLPVHLPESNITPFLIDIDPSVIENLYRRLAGTRWTDEVENAGWDYGTNEAYLRELCAYWQNDYDWREQERMLNDFHHFKTTIDGTGIHFIHHTGEGSPSIPLLLTHGYPDSFARFLKIIPLLTKADEHGLSFDVVVPSIPGYGFSEIPKHKGMDTDKVAGLFAKLMTERLGYEKFMAHGGDSGSSITEAIALYHEESVTGIHLTDIPWQHLLTQPEEPTAAEKKFFEKNARWQQTEGAYALIQSTKPQTLAYGLNDSPAGLAAWIIEKFKTWSDNKGDIENAFSKEELLTNLTIFWITGTINSAFRLYYESIKSVMNAKYNPLVKLNPFDRTNAKTEVPTAFALFPKDITSPPKDFADRYFNVQRWTEMDRGGHFAAMEEPELLVADIRAFANSLYGNQAG
jgi:pimeloyl-ACP methyl ester carboxylesterase